MNFVPVIIINLILLIITILLAIADRLLVTYGQCKITVHHEEEEREFMVQGGSYLLTNMVENNIKITSSCAGKASCGYCKVWLKGGGPILPTEEIFMSRKEKLTGMRLACQVKVKEDLDIYIPDFLSTVESIVRNKTFDPKLRWRFLKVGQEDVIPGKTDTKLSHDDKAKVYEIIDKHSDVPSAMVPVLQGINGTFKYLPEPVLRYTAKVMDRPISELYRIATFYNAFSLEPRGKYVINICMGTACHVKGAADILSTFERELGIKMGETTADKLFTLEAVMCIGCCGLAPVLKVNENVHGLMTKKEVPKLIKKYRESQDEEA